MSTQLQTQLKVPLQQSFTAEPTGLLQRKCACGQHTVAGGECEECRQKREEMIQRASVTAAPVNAVPPIVHDALSSPGQPLDAGTRAFMEPRFGHDFSRVRVHTDAKAAESARAVNALAYTVGRDVVFGPGQYEPETGKGRRLLAHELTHVVQQGGSASTPLDISSSDTTHEHEANCIASAMQAGQSASINTGVSSSLLQRQEDLRLRMPQFPGMQQRQIGLFPPGQRPRLHLDVSVLRPLFELQGISNLRPFGQPRLRGGLSSLLPANLPPAWLPGPGSAAPSPSPHIPAADDPNKIVDWQFSMDVEEMSLMAYTLRRLGLPLQTPAERAQEQFDQLQAIFSGREVEDTPLGVRLLATSANVLENLVGATPGGGRFLERTHLNNVTFIVDPSSRTVGIQVQILIPPRRWLP